MFKDKFGIIWMSSLGIIWQFDPNSNQFEFDPIAVSNKNINQAVINSIHQKPNENSKIIIGTNTEGLLIYDINKKNVLKL